MEQDYRIPSNLDALPVIFFFEIDEFILLVSGTFLGIFISHTFIVLTLTAIGLYLFHRMKKKKHKGFIFHLLYRAGLVSPKYMPPYHIKEFGG